MANVIALFILFGPAVIFLILFLVQRKKTKNLLSQSQSFQERIASLEKYDGILDIDKIIENKRHEAEQIKTTAQNDADEIIQKAKAEAEQMLEGSQEELNKVQEEKRTIIAQAKEKAAEVELRANATLQFSQKNAMDIMLSAQEKAKEIAGEAYTIKEHADQYKDIADAMLNKIEGYGNRYIIPGRILLDDLADEYGFDKAAQDYKNIKRQIDVMVENRTAATCDYVEPHRKATAVDFVVDAFNGKATVILSKIKKDNYGQLKQELHDAFILVNHNGKSFRDARITKAFLEQYYEALRFGTILYEMKEKDKEEQRAIRDQMRDEEKARREIERAMKDAAKQEEVIQSALAKAREKYAVANEEQKSKYESQLAELEAKLKEAEEKNQKALSMAQQTKSGHVYIISNVGSLGEDILKIGMTRRLEPLDRVKELGDASVPFAFDVHAMIWSQDAPSLENALHKHFALSRVNKINNRKEFYKATIASVKEEIETLGIKEIKWTLQSEAREYYDTIALEKQFDEDPAVQESWLVANTKDFDSSKIALLSSPDENSDDD
ncbi:MAG: DUF4041 domain-containing protein [Cloacibacillus sp.]